MQIGGSCVELESTGKRMLIDIGLPLDTELPDTPLPPVPGLELKDLSLLGIAISHPHLDHYGLIAKIKQDVPILIGRGALKILEASSILFNDFINFSNTIELQDRKTISLGPFNITPFLMDHSAYDAYAFLIEADERRLFYSGDFRGHGRKRKLFEKLIKNPPPNIDVLLMEGTSLGRVDRNYIYNSEIDLEMHLAEDFNRKSGLILLWASPQNIDRMVTVFRACQKAGKKFIVDFYAANILRSIGNPKLPQPGWKGIKVFVPRFQRIKIKERLLFDLVEDFSSCRVYPEDLAIMANDSVMLFRPSMAQDVLEAGCIDNAILIYSLWSGYLMEERYQWFCGWLDDHNIPVIERHTSGHAPLHDLQRFAKALAPNLTVPIHSSAPDQYPVLFDNVYIKRDGEWWEV